jgi:hypothetical protein
VQCQSVGLIGGLNRTAISGDRPETISYGKATNLQIGGFGEFDFLGETQLRVELAYSQRGTRIGHEVEDQREPNYSGRLNLDYLSIPILLKISSKSGRVYTTSGLDVSILMAATLEEDGQPDVDVKDQLLSSDLAVNFGFGGVVHRGRPQVGLEVRYTQSLFNLGDNVQTASAVPVRFRSGGLQFLVSVGLPVGGKR